MPNGSDAVHNAEALVPATAEKVEKMAALSADPKKSFLEMHPMIEELRRTWAALDAGLAALPRQEVKRVRAAQQPRMSAAAHALCMNLVTAKMRDRAAGIFPPPKIELKADTLGDRFAVAILKADYVGACALMAPWLQNRWTDETLRLRVEEECAAIGKGFEMDPPPPPAEYEIGSNPMSIAELRDEYFVNEDPIPAEITEENFVAWVPVTITPDADDSWLTDIGYLLAPYLITVRDSGQEKIGYLRFGEE